jgi:hypothetical protein
LAPSSVFFRVSKDSTKALYSVAFYSGLGPL